MLPYNKTCLDREVGYKQCAELKELSSSVISLTIQHMGQCWLSIRYFLVSTILPHIAAIFPGVSLLFSWKLPSII